MVLGLPLAGAAVLGGIAAGATINFWIAAVTSRKSVPVARVYRWLVLATAMFCVASLGTYLSPTLPLAFAAEVARSAFNVGGNLGFVLFAVVYTGYRDWLTRRRVALLAAEPAAYVALLATNPFHGLVLTDVHTVQVLGLTVLRSQATLLTSAHLVFTLALTTSGYVLLGRFYLSTRNVYRRQAGVIILGSLGIPLAAFLYSFGATPIDLTPFALVLNGIIVWVALFRYDFLDVVPLAADLLLEEMTDAVVVTDANGTVRDVNGSAEWLFSGEQDPLGQPLTAVAPDLDAALDDGEPFVHSASVDAPTRTFASSVTRIDDQYGIHRGTLIVLHDVTEQIRRQTKLERQNEHLDEFASVVSHDLRNPLSIAKGFVDLAREEEDLAHLDRVDEALDRMNALVDDLLTQARQGQTVDAAEPVRLDVVATAAWRNVDGDASLVDDTDLTIEADRSRLQQLLENLFRNSVEHSSTSSRPAADDSVEHGSTGNRAKPDDSVEHGSTGSRPAVDDSVEHVGSGVTVRVGRLEEGFYVEDDGPGIPPEKRELVFEHGYSSSATGTGFGLAIVRSIAHAHGWEVALVEGSDGGARFEFMGVETA